MFARTIIVGFAVVVLFFFFFTAETDKKKKRYIEADMGLSVSSIMKASLCVSS